MGREPRGLRRGPAHGLDGEVHGVPRLVDDHRARVGGEEEQPRLAGELQLDLIELVATSDLKRITYLIDHGFP